MHIFDLSPNRSTLSLNKETMEQLFKTFAYHAKKYCPTEGKCLTPESFKNRRKKTLQTSFTLPVIKGEWKINGFKKHS